MVRWHRWARQLIVDLAAAWRTLRDEQEPLEHARAALDALLTQAFAFRSPDAHISVRLKTPRSYLNKLTTPKKAVGAWPYVDDLLGGRVSFNSTGEVEKATSLIRASEGLRRVRVEKKKGKPTDLYYPGTHIIAELVGADYSTSAPVRCEIQLRTKAQDAWSSVSHKLAYKAGIPITARTQRKIWRLVAVMEVFDEDVDQLLKQRNRNKAAQLVDAFEVASEMFSSITGQPTESPARLDLIETMLPAYSENERTDLARLVATFGGSHTEALRAAYASFDPADAAFDPYQDWLALQPESVLVLERAFSRPVKIAEAVLGSSIEEPTRALFHAVDIPWPLDD